MAEQLLNQAKDGGANPTSPLQFVVRQIPARQTYEWIRKKHYAHRIPQIQYAFGLYDMDNVLQGVCTFGNACRMITEKYAPVPIFELNRLVISDGIRNAATYFVSRCFRLFPVHPCFIVSYADSNQMHHGYIYQALNGIYTGLSSTERLVYVNGKLKHRRSLNSLYGTSSVEELSHSCDVETVEQEGKHRYFFVVGTKQERRSLQGKIDYPILAYPKGDNQRYDASYEPTRQGVLI